VCVCTAACCAPAAFHNKRAFAGGYISQPRPSQTTHKGWQNHPVSRSRWHFIVPCAAAAADVATLPGAVEAAARGEPVTGATIAEPGQVRRGLSSLCLLL
jgi:hypothetical protein